MGTYSFFMNYIYISRYLYLKLPLSNPLSHIGRGGLNITLDVFLRPEGRVFRVEKSQVYMLYGIV